MPSLDGAVIALLRKMLNNNQLIEDFIDDPNLETKKDSKLHQQVEQARMIESSLKRDEALKILEKRQKELYKFKKIIFKHLIQDASFKTMEKLKKRIFFLKRKLGKEEKSKIIFLDLISKKVDAKISSVKHKEKKSNIYLVGSGVFTALSGGCGAASSHFPVLSFILLPLQHGFNFLNYLLWIKSIENDQSVSQEEKDIVKAQLNSIKNNNYGSAITGMMGGALLLLSATIPPIAPITLALGTFAILVSNILISVSALKDLYREIKHGKKDAGTKARISSYILNFSFAVSSTLGSTLLLTAAVLALAFPPAAMAVAGTFALMGLIFSAITIGSFVASKISLHIANKQSSANKPQPKKDGKRLIRKIRKENSLSERESLIKRHHSENESDLRKSIGHDFMLIEKKSKHLNRLIEMQLRCENKLVLLQRKIDEFPQQQMVPEEIKKSKEALIRGKSKIIMEISDVKRFIGLKKRSLHKKTKLLEKLIQKRRLNIGQQSQYQARNVPEHLITRAYGAGQKKKKDQPPIPFTLLDQKSSTRGKPR